MQNRSRRDFLADVARGMMVASLGQALAADLAISPARADEGPRTLSFGAREPLVVLMEETPADRLLPLLVERVQTGTSLRELIAAGALANARKFGGQDYIGFHTFMAMSPALRMAEQLPAAQRPLPVLKVLYRNAARIQETGGRKSEALQPVTPADTNPSDAARAIRDAVHRQDREAAERALAGAVAASPHEAYNQLLETVDENADVHRIVLAHRVWDMLDLVGLDHAETMLRQSLRYCLDNERSRAQHSTHPANLVPKLIDRHHLFAARKLSRTADDAWTERTSRTLFESSAEQAAELIAAALAEGFDFDNLFEAISLATNQLVLRDAGRTGQQIQPNKPAGSVHGDSIGVHACDSTHAWRNIARVGNQRTAVCSVILAAYQAAYDRVARGGKFDEWQPRPHADQLAAVKSPDRQKLVEQLDEAIRENNQELACAVTHRYGELGYDAQAIFNVLLKYAVSEDGALHAEKYYRTVNDEFAATRSPFRWRQLVALARVTASEYGRPAPGHAEACRLIGA